MMALDEAIEFGKARQMLTKDEDFTVPKVENLLRLDLASGKKVNEGFTGVDKYKDETSPKDLIQHDLEVYPWPFKDESVYEIICEHYIEHIPGQYGLVNFMEEVYRILMPLGTIKIQAPYYTSMRAVQDPTHVRPICDLTFSYFDKSQLKNANLDHYFGKADFEILTLRHFMNEEWESRGDEARIWAARHYFNAVDDIMAVLRKREIPK